MKTLTVWDMITIIARMSNLVNKTFGALYETYLFVGSNISRGTIYSVWYIYIYLYIPYIIQQYIYVCVWVYVYSHYDVIVWQY